MLKQFIITNLFLVISCLPTMPDKKFQCSINNNCPSGYICLKEGKYCSKITDDCVLKCEGKECGDDGCGGICGECTDFNKSYCNNGQCQCNSDFCKMNVNGAEIKKECGDDGCGNSCGKCDTNKTCTNGKCECRKEYICDQNCCFAGDVCKDGECCKPDCANKECGDDGCGGSCGECNANETCVNNKCECQKEYICDQDCCFADETCSSGKCCKPNCTNKKCGDDGCFGLCGACKINEKCEKNQCVCQYHECEKICCSLKEQVCDNNNQCCTPNCKENLWECGTDDCGIACGTCNQNNEKCGDDKKCKKQSVKIDSKLPDTGQTDCYNNNSSCYFNSEKECTCDISSTGDKCCPYQDDAFFGQDASYETNALGSNNFVNNLNGTITDNVTGLMWMKCIANHDWANDNCAGDVVQKNWDGAKQYCSNLQLAGYGAGQWRLPTRFELQTIVNYGKSEPAIDELFFNKSTDKEGIYWSESFVADANEAWTVRFKDGFMSTELLDSQFYTRCVRDDEKLQDKKLIIQKYESGGEETVIDTGSKLTWQKKTETAKLFTWHEAVNYCETLELAGSSDFRLPDIKELSSLVKDSEKDPSIEKTFFSITYLPNNAAHYWSSSTNVMEKNKAWAVDFYNGFVSSKKKDQQLTDKYYVRCVR